MNARNLSVLTIALILSILSCRNKEEIDDLDILSTPPQCFNESFDMNELGTDCGGPCEPCTYFSPSCTVSDQSLDFETSDVNTVTENLTSVTVDSSNGFVIRGISNNTRITLSFIRRPDLSTFFSSESSARTTNEYELTIRSDNYGNAFPSDDNGQLRIRFDEETNEYVLTGCGARVSRNVGFSTRSTILNYSLRVKK